MCETPVLGKMPVKCLRGTYDCRSHGKRQARAAG